MTNQNGLEWENKPSHATVPLKVPKHENFILVDFRDFFTKQTPWDSDPVDMILKIICNGQALMYRV